jgi:nucleotide-binding universal stress UspA family protein
VIGVILLLMGVMALITHLIGVHTVLGAFVAGILVGESPILTRHIDEQLRGLIMGLFMPVFFGLAGLSVDLTILRDPMLVALTAGLIVIASVGKFAGAFVGGEIGGMTRWESLALACGMNARGSTEVIVASIGLSMGVLTQSLFTMIVTMAVVTTLAMPPMLRWALVRLPLDKEEAARLEREEFEAKGFLANLERLLLAVDESDNGRFASRITGLIAGSRGIPTTVLHVGPDAKRQEEKRSTETSAEAAVKAGAQTIAAQEEEETRPAPLAVITRAKEAGTKEAVADEARKGYGLLVIGLLRTLGPDGGFHRELARVAAGFDGPLALVMARGRHLENPTDSRFRILVPIDGTEASRRAAEVAVALARANDVPLTALYVPDVTTTRSGATRARPGTATRRYEEAILKDVVALADRYDTGVRTAMRVDLAPDEAILREARSGHHDLIVIGADRRPGDTLFFGNVAASVIAKAKSSILLVSS